MKLSHIIEVLELKKVYLSDVETLQKQYEWCFASDLMSDVLYYVNHNQRHTLLVTGLCNVQSLRTAEMLDIDTVIYVRNKTVSEEMIDLAKEKKINIFECHKTMFHTCGILYDEGMKEAS